MGFTRTWVLLKESINILLEGVPEGIQLSSIHNELAAIPKVCNVHDLHVWAVTSGKVSLTVHLVIDANSPETQSTNAIQLILKTAHKILIEKFNITHTTIQIETENCGHDDLDKANHLSY